MEHLWIAASIFLLVVLSNAQTNPVYGGGAWNYNYQSSNTFGQSPGSPIFNSNSFGQSPGGSILNSNSGGGVSSFLNRFNPTQRLNSLVTNVYSKTDRYDLASSVLRAVIEHAVGVFVPG